MNNSRSGAAFPTARTLRDPMNPNPPAGGTPSGGNVFGKPRDPNARSLGGGEGGDAASGYGGSTGMRRAGDSGEETPVSIGQPKSMFVKQLNQPSGNGGGGKGGGGGLGGGGKSGGSLGGGTGGPAHTGGMGF